MDPDTIRSLRFRIRMDLLPYCEGGSMIPMDLSANCEGWIYYPNGSGIQIPGSIFRIHGHVWVRRYDHFEIQATFPYV